MRPSNSVSDMNCAANDTATLRRLVSSDSPCPTVELADHEYDLSGGELEVKKSVILVGNGAVLDAYASDSDDRRVLIIASGVEVHLQDLRITGGHKRGDYGGGVHTSGILTMSGCNVTGNTAVCANQANTDAVHRKH